MSTPLTKQQLADLLDKTTRSINRYIQQGCPWVPGPHGEQLFVLEEVEAWLRRHHPQDDPAPATPLAASPAAAGVARDVRQRAEAAKAFATAKRAELDAQAEKGLRQLGLDEKILAATSFEDLASVAREVAAAALRGDLLPGRATVVRQLISDVRQSMIRALEGIEEGEELGRMLLLTEESATAAQLFDSICNGWRRRWALEALRALLVEDQKEFPDGEVPEAWTPPLEALGLDLAGNPVGDAWPAYLPPPAIPPAQHVAPRPCANKEQQP